jgi:Fe2+ transport system protein B
MAEARHVPREPKHKARKKEDTKSLWHKLKGSALFWLLMIILFTVLVVFGIIQLSKLLSGN